VSALGELNVREKWCQGRQEGLKLESKERKDEETKEGKEANGGEDN